MFRLIIAGVLFAFIVLFCAVFPRLTSGQDLQQPKTDTTVHLRWGQRPGVARYRLQLALDANFRDIVFDRVINGNEAEVNDLAPGRYFWRIAPLAKTLGDFSSPAIIEIRANTIPSLTPTPSPVKPPANSIVTTGGWRAAVGDISRPMIAHLRSRNDFDVVGTNNNGVTFALSSANGVPLWSVRTRRIPGSSLTNGSPLIIPARLGLDDVLVFDGPVAIKLEGKTGCELWRSQMTVVPSSAVIAFDISGPVVAIIDNSLRRLIVMNAVTGAVVSQTLLPSRAVGPAAQMPNRATAILIAYETGEVELRDRFGAKIRSGFAGETATTSPVVVKGRHQDLILLGTREGLTAFSAVDLKPLGRVTIKDDSPRGNLTTEDLNGDGIVEVIMMTQRGHVIANQSEDGKIIWDAVLPDMSPAIGFADLNGDNTVDVVFTGTQTFAAALSGRDGSMIWKDADSSAPIQSNNFPPRGLALVPLPSGMLLVSSDVSRTSLRAIEFPKATVRPSQYR